MQWAGCAIGVAGSFVLARNDRYSGWGFVAYLASSVAWLVYGLATDVHALAIQHVVFMGVSGFGVWRWLVRPPMPPGTASPDSW
jgi:drug/metabolite transporter (DMT)-like permease